MEYPTRYTLICRCLSFSTSSSLNTSPGKVACGLANPPVAASFQPGSP